MREEVEAAIAELEWEDDDWFRRASSEALTRDIAWEMERRAMELQDRVDALWRASESVRAAMRKAKDAGVPIKFRLPDA